LTESERGENIDYKFSGGLLQTFLRVVGKVIYSIAVGYAVYIFCCCICFKYL